MPAPRKPRPHVELDDAAIDDGWFLPSEGKKPVPASRPPKPAASTPPAKAAQPAPRPRKRLEDWFDEVDLGWVLPDELGPPAPHEVAAGPEDVEAAYEEIEVSAEPEETEVSAEPEETEVSAEPAEMEPPTESAGDDRLDLNTATLEELLALPGVGPKKARAIIAWREDNQGFRNVEDLAQVPGFGAKSVARLADRLAVRGP